MGPQTPFSSGVPKGRSLLFGVEVGGGESKDLLLHFGIYATKFGDRTLALIDGASNMSGGMSGWEIVRLILAGAVVMAVFLPILFFVKSHISNPTATKLIGQGALLALVVLVSFVATWRRLKPE